MATTTTKAPCKVITFASQKGCCTKTISAACTAWLLPEKQKVLMVDLDAQGNLTEIITQKPLRWWRQNADTNVMDAIKSGDPRPSIVEIHHQPIFGSIIVHLKTTTYASVHHR